MPKRPSFPRVNCCIAGCKRGTTKRRKQARREVRAGLEAERTLTALDVAAAQVPVEAPPRPDTTIVRPIRHRATAGSAALKPQPAAAVPDAGEEEIIAALGAVRLRVVE